MNLLFISHHRRFKTTARPTPVARELVRRGHRVTLVCAANTSRFAFREYEEAGIHYIEAPDLLWGKMRSGWDPVSALRRARQLKKLSFDVIQSFEARPSVIYPVLALRRAANTPMVMDWIDWWGRGGLIAELRPQWYQILFGGMETYYEEHFRTFADQTTVISHALGDRARGLGVNPDTIHWIPGGVDTKLFQPLEPMKCREQYNLPGDKLILVYSAMDVTNDAALVFEAVARALKTRSDLLLVMAGHPSPQLIEAAQRAGLGDAFRHVGLIPHAKLPELLSTSDIALLPYTTRVSNLGRWPNKIGDYMAVGLPTVTHAVGEMEYLTRREPIALTARDESPNSFADAILELAESPERRRQLGGRARELAVREFDWPLIAARFESVYLKAAKST